MRTANSLGRKLYVRRKWPIGVCVAARFHNRRGGVVDPRRVRWRGGVAVALGKLGEMRREFCNRVSAPPDQVIAFTGLSRFCAWPVFFQIEQVVVQTRIIRIVPRPGTYERLTGVAGQAPRAIRGGAV